MPRKAPIPLFDLINQFLDDPQPNRIMFCRRFYVRDVWDISAGAVLDLTEALPGLIEVCKGLYKEDKRWFIGDIGALLDHGIT